MAGRARQRPPGARARSLRWVVASAVVLFLILDAVLIVLAFTRDDAASSARLPAPIPTFDSGSSGTPSPSPSIAPLPAAAPRLLIAASDTVGWRSTAGGCAGQDAAVEVTTDGGETWAPLDPPELHQVLGMTSPNDSTLRIVGRAGASCAVGSFASFTRGQFWNFYPDSTGDFTFIDPASPTTVHTPTGNLLAPCDVNELHTRDESIAISCDDQFLEREAVAAVWLSVAAPGLLAFTPSDTGYTLALAGVADCPGISIQSLVAPIGTVPPTVVGCLADELDPSEVTIAETGTTVWLWTSDRLRISSDGGATWAP